MKTWQRDYPTVAIRKWFPGLMYPSFQEHDLNFIPEAKISKKLRPIKKMKKIRHLSCDAPFTKENNHQSLPTSLLNHGEKPARRLMKKFRNVGVPSNIEARCRTAEKSTDWVIPSVLLNNKLRLLYETYSCINFSSSSLNFTNRKRENNREVVSLNRDSETITDNTLNVVEQENWIQRICSKIKSILPDLHAKIRLHSTTASDSYCSENIFAVNQVIPFSDIISNNAILFASKDCEDDRPKIGIREKIQEFCMQRKRSLKKNRDKNDICQKRQKCNTERKCQKRENICERKKIDCSERRKRTGDRQNVVSCKRRKNSRDKENARDCRKTRERKVEVQEDSCKQKKDDTSRTKKDPCSGQSPMKQKETLYKLHNTDPCRVDKKEEIETKELHDTDPCRLDKKKEIEKKEWHDTDPCKLDKKKEIEKKEETKKPDCEEIKKVDLCKKKTCPTVKRAPDCPEDDAKRKDR